MATHRALVLESFSEPLKLQTLPKPTAKTGEAVVKVVAAAIVVHTINILNGKLQYPLSLPLTPGGTAIGRIEEVGADAVNLEPGQLVLCDTFIKGRDNPDVSILLGMHNGGYPAAQKLMDGEWRHGAFAEYAKFPLENVFALNENRLTKELGYSITDLSILMRYMIPMGGMGAIDIGPGDTVIVAPASGKFGGGAVAVAIALGATVIAAARNGKALEELKTVPAFAETGRLRTVTLSGDVGQDCGALIAASGSPAGPDAYVDFSPAAAAKSTHILASILALRTNGRAVFMGGIGEPIQLPYGLIMFKCLKICGKYSYERSDTNRLIKMAEAGNLKLGSATGVKTTGEFGLEQGNEAVKAAADSPGFGTQVLLKP